MCMFYAIQTFHCIICQRIRTNEIQILKIIARFKYITVIVCKDLRCECNSHKCCMHSITALHCGVGGGDIITFSKKSTASQHRLNDHAKQENRKCKICCHSF